MSIYTPYFYIIQDTRNGMYYVGAKWAKNANPDNFMVENGYQTSSKIINSIIKNHGLGVLTIRKIRVFGTSDKAYDYETRFLEKVDARRNPNFYNGHNNEATVISANTEMAKIISLEKYGVEYYTQSEEYRQRYHKTCMEKYSLPFHTQSETTKAAQRKTNLEKRGVENPSHCPIVCDKISKAIRKTKGTPEWKETKGKEQGKGASEMYSGRIFITDGETNKVVDPNSNLSDGWYIGRTEPIDQCGNIRITNGIENTAIKSMEQIPDGWYRGITRKNKSHQNS